MPERARVFVGADEGSQKYYKGIITAASHQVIAQATSIAEALRQIPEFPNMRIQVAVLDTFDGLDGGIPQAVQVVIDAIREQAQGVRIISTFGPVLDRVDVHHGPMDIELLGTVGEVITQL